MPVAEPQVAKKVTIKSVGILFRKEDYARVVNATRRFRPRDPSERAELTWMHAHSLYRLKRRAEALQVARDGYREFPDHTKLSQTLALLEFVTARTHHLKGKTEEALAALEAIPASVAHHEWDRLALLRLAILEALTRGQDDKAQPFPLDPAEAQSSENRVRLYAAPDLFDADNVHPIQIDMDVHSDLSQSEELIDAVLESGQLDFDFFFAQEATESLPDDEQLRTAALLEWKGVRDLLKSGEPAQALAAFEAVSETTAVVYHKQLLLLRARALQSLDRHDEALALADEALQSAPDDTQVQNGHAYIEFARARALAKLEDPGAVLAAAKAARPHTLQLYNAQLIYLQALALQRLDRYQDALDLAEAAARASPDSEALRSVAAQIEFEGARRLLRDGRPEDALAAVDAARADAVRIYRPLLLLLRAEALLSMNRQAEAHALAGEALQSAPEDTRVKNGHAYIEFVRVRSLAKMDDPGAVLAAAKAVQPHTLRTYGAQLIHLQGLALQRLKRYQDALDLAQEAVRASPDSEALRSVAAQIEFEGARRLLRDGRPDDALAAIAAAGADADLFDRPLFLLLRAEALQGLDRHDEALALADEVFQSAPENTQVQNSHAYIEFVRARSLAKLDDPGAVLAAAKAARPHTLQMYSAQLIHLQGLALQRLKRYQDALDLAQEAVRASPNSQVLRNVAAQIEFEGARRLLRDGRPEEALAAIDAAGADADRVYRPLLLLLRAEALLSMNRQAEANALADEALQSAPNDPRVRNGHAHIEFIKVRMLARSGNAEAVLEAADAVPPLTAQLHGVQLTLLRGQALQRLKRYNDALELARGAVLSSPDNEALKKVAAQIEFEGARGLFRDGRPEDVLSAIEIMGPRASRTYRPRVLMLRAQALHQLKRTDEALAVIHQSLAEFPENLELRSFIVDRKLETAQACLAAKDFARALEAVQSIENPTDKQRQQELLLRLNALRGLGRHADVVQLAREALNWISAPAVQSQLITREWEAANALARDGQLELQGGLAALAVRQVTDHPGAVSASLFRKYAQVLSVSPYAEALAEQIPGDTIADAGTALLLGTVKISQGHQVAGAELCRQASGKGLPGHLSKIATDEVSAARFHKLGAGEVTAGPALVIIEPGANLDLVRLALDHADEVHVCSEVDVSPQSLPGVAGTPDEARIKPFRFRRINLPDLSGIRDGFSHAFVSHAADHIPEMTDLCALGGDHPAALTINLRSKVQGAVAYVYNAIAAQNATGARKLFFILSTNTILPPVVLHLLKDPQFEVHIACGSPNHLLRETFSKSIASGDLFQSSPQSDPDWESVLEPIGASKLKLGSPFSEPFPPPSLRPDRKRCILLCGWHQIGAPLRSLIEMLLTDWDPLVIVMNKRADEKLVAQIETVIGDLLPHISLKILYWYSAIQKAPPRSDFVRAASKLLSDPRYDEFKLKDMALSSFVTHAAAASLNEAYIASHMTATFDSIVEAWGPEFALTYNYSYSLDHLLMLLSARRCGVPTLGVQNLLYGKDDRLYRLPVDRMLCFDRVQADIISEMTGFPADRTAVIGSVTYDAMLKRARSFVRDDERIALDVPSDVKMVLVATQPIALEHNEQLVELTLQALKDIPARIVVKLHPSEPESRISVFLQQAKEYGMLDRIMVTKSHDIYRLLAAADLVVNMTSNVGIEAALLDHDVVAVEIGLDTQHFSLGDIGLVDVARTADDARSQIRDLMLNPEARAAAQAKRDQFFSINSELHDGRSVDRLLETLRSVDTDPAFGALKPSRTGKQKLWFLVRPTPNHRDVVRQWADQLRGRVCFVFLSSKECTDLDLSPHDIRFVVGGVVPTNSDDEEEAYRTAAEFYDAVPSTFESFDFYGVDLSHCVKRLTNVAPEYLLRLARGLDIVRREGYDNIVVWLSHLSPYQLAIIDEATTLGLCEPRSSVLQIVDGAVVAMPEIFETTSPEEHLPPLMLNWQKSTDVIGESLAKLPPLDPGGVHVLVPHASPTYLPHLGEAIRIVRDTGLPYRVLASSSVNRDKLLTHLGDDSIPEEKIVIIPGLRECGYSADPERIMAALKHTFTQTALRASAAIDSGESTELGRRTLDFVWRHCSAPSTVSNAYELCLRIERLHALIEHDKPACFYTYPAISPYDPAPTHLMRARGGVAASSIFLSVTADYRNLVYPEYDEMAVLGTEQTEALVSRGYPAQQIFELGSPLLDAEFAKWSHGDARDCLSGLLDRDLSRGPLILVATSAFRQADELVWLQWLADALPRNAGLSVVIKLHQSANPAPYEQLVTTIGHPDMHVTQKGDIYPYLATSEVVISDVSHAGKLAVYAGKKLWVANISGEPFPYNRFDEQGVAMLASTPDDFADIVAEAKGETSFERRTEDIAAFVRREFTSNDGKARERMAAFFRACVKPR